MKACFNLLKPQNFGWKMNQNVFFIISLKTSTFEHQCLIALNLLINFLDFNIEIRASFNYGGM